MKVHQVKYEDIDIAHQFQIDGDLTTELEERLVNTINHFYEITGSIFLTRSYKNYVIHVDRKGGNQFAYHDRINFNSIRLTEWTIVHELGHALDASYGWQLSKRMRAETGSGFPIKILHKAFPRWKVFWYRVGSPPPPCGVNAKFNSIEDFAETVTAFIFPEKAKEKAAARGFNYEKYGYTHFHETPRGRFFQKLLDEHKKEAPSI